MIKSSNKKFNGNELKYLKLCLDNGLKFSKKEGSYTFRLEKLWSKFHKIKHSVTINSCTSGLHVSLLALGISKGDEVLVSALTPIMCGTTIHFTGATPIYVDVDKDTFLMSAKDAERKITKNTKAIILVHMYGGVNNIKLFQNIAKKNNIYLIEDCAEALGAKDENGILAGSTSDLNCWSFQSAKHITCGDGGIVSTNNKKFATNVRKISNLGFKFLSADSGQVALTKEKRQNTNFKRFDKIGFNYRLNEFSAGIALAQFEKLNKFLYLRRKMGKKIERIVNKYSFVKAQFINKKAYSTYYTAAVKILNIKKLPWIKFKKKFIEYGGTDGIYAPAQIIQNEPVIKKKLIGRCFSSCKYGCVRLCRGTPNASLLQKSLLLFTTNQMTNLEINRQAASLKKTLKFFNSYL